MNKLHSFLRELEQLEVFAHFSPSMHSLLWWPLHSQTSYVAAEDIQRIKPKHVKDLITLMILMVIIFLVLLFWENELDEEAMVATLEQLHVDYPQSDIPIRYCNHMIIQRVIKEPNNTCKKEHFFIHERPRNINRVCSSSRRVTCQNHAPSLCFLSEIKFKMTVCKLIEGTRYPACNYRVFATEGFIVVTCDDTGPAKIQRYTE